MLKRIPLFCQETGYSEKAVARKIEDGVWVEVAFRNGSQYVGFAYRFGWAHRGCPSDIVRYRVCE